MTVDQERSATLVIRIWLEDENGFRARLTGARVSSGEEFGADLTVAVAATPRQVIDAVRVWLDEFTRGGLGP